MPKNKGKGGKNRRRGKNENESTKRELVYKDEGQEYGLVKNVLGGNQLAVQCMDDRTRMCIIRGKMRKKVWIGVNDYVLVSLRPYQPDIGDVIYKYNNDEVRTLQNEKELRELTATNATDDIVFTNETIKNLEIHPDTMADVDLIGVHNPNRPLRSNFSDSEDETDSEEESDEESEEEDDSEDDKEREKEEMRKKMASIGIDEMIGGGAPKVDYKINTSRQQTNTLLEMSKGGNSSDSSSEEEAVPSNAELMQKLSSFRKNFGQDRITKSNKKR